MLKRSVVVKLWLAFVLLVVAVMVPLEFALHRLLTDFYARQVTEPLLYHNEQLAQMLAMDPGAIHMAPMMGHMVGGQVLVINGQGEPVSFPGAAEVSPPGEAVRATLQGASFVGQAIVDNAAYIVTGVPVSEGGGAVLLLAPAEPVQRSLMLARRYLWLAGTGTLLLGTGLAFMLARQLIRPIIAIEKATLSIAEGDFSTQVEVTTSDEVGRLADAVNRMTAKLKAFETRRREFLANVAHELRTPLSYIRGYTQALAEGLVTGDEERERYQRIVQEEAVRIGRLVDDLMDMAQMEEGYLALEKSPLDLRLPIEQAVAAIRPVAEGRGVRILVAQPEGLSPVLADSGRIQQVVFNLLDNALRYTPPGGEVCIRFLSTEAGVRVSVEDTGPGIEPDQLPLIFERFQRRHSGGRGLGLAIVKSIIRTHGGEVGVTSQPGRGSIFWFQLPLAR